MICGGGPRGAGREAGRGGGVATTARARPSAAAIALAMALPPWRFKKSTQRSAVSTSSGCVEVPPFTKSGWFGGTFCGRRMSAARVTSVICGGLWKPDCVLLTSSQSPITLAPMSSLPKRWGSIFSLRSASNIVLETPCSSRIYAHSFSP